MTLDRLWRLLSNVGELCWPRGELADAIGEAAVNWIEATRVGRIVPIPENAPSYPCRTPHRRACAMRLVHEGDRRVAVCGLAPAQCAERVLEGGDATMVEISAATLVPRLQESLALSGPVIEQFGVVSLGQRRFGTTRVDFALIADPDHPLTDAWMQLHAERNPGRGLAAIHFHPGETPVGALQRQGVEWVALAHAEPSDRGLVVDLTDVIDRLAPGSAQGHELWPRYLVVADPLRDAFWYAGHPLELPAEGRRLLTLLLLQPGVWVSRSALLPRVFPDRFVDRFVYDRVSERLRKVMQRLRGAVAELDLPAGVRTDPFDTERSLDDTVGGYRIDVRPDRIRWLSDPSADLADLGGPSRGPRRPR